MENQKPKALQCAEHLEQFRSFEKDLEAAAELRRLHARIQELEAKLESVGAGGVSAQRVTQVADHIAQDSNMVEAPVVLPEPVAAQVRKVMLAINEEQLKKAKSHNTYIVGVIADKIEDGTLFNSGIYRRREIAEIVRNLLSTVTEFQAAAQEPFGYFKSEPLGWRDCAETDEGVIALYESPQPQADALDTERLNWLIEQGCSNGVVYESVFGDFWMVWLDGNDARKDKHQAYRYPTAREAIDAAIAAEKEHK